MNQRICPGEKRTGLLPENRLGFCRNSPERLCMVMDWLNCVSD